MPDHDRFLWVYFKLAQISHQKKQVIPRNKFLILMAVEACKAGCLEIANRCMDIVINRNHKHLLNNYENFADAMRDDDFALFIDSLENQFCSREQGEHLFVQAEKKSKSGFEEPSESELASAILEQMGDQDWQVTL